MKEMSDSEKLQVMNQAIKNYNGATADLEKAIGFFYIGFVYGWKPLYIMHSKKTVRKYENILEISVRDIYPEFGKRVSQSSYSMLNNIPNFWKMVSGEIPFEKSKFLQGIEYPDEDYKLGD